MPAEDIRHPEKNTAKERKELENKTKKATKIRA